jgi:hypothetical protein
MSRPIRRNEAETALRVLERTRKRINGYKVNNRHNLRQIIRDRVAAKHYQPLLDSFISGKIDDWYLQQHCPFGIGPEMDRLNAMIGRLKESIRRKKRNNWPLLAEVSVAKKEASAFAEMLREGLQRTGNDLPVYAQKNLEWLEQEIKQAIQEWEGKTEDDREIFSAEQVIASNEQQNERRRRKIEELRQQITTTEAEIEGLRARIRQLRPSSSKNE